MAFQKLSIVWSDMRKIYCIMTIALLVCSCNRGQIGKTLTDLDEVIRQAEVFDEEFSLVQPRTNHVQVFEASLLPYKNMYIEQKQIEIVIFS